jgi:CBS domain-containing protein
MKYSRAPYSLPLSLDSEVREVMTPGVVSIPENATLQRAHEALVAHSVHALLVTDRNTGTPVGWITARGLLSWATSRTGTHTARQAVTEAVITISPSASTEKAVALMLDGDVSHLLVAVRADAMPEGVLSDTDVVRLGGRR